MKVSKIFGCVLSLHLGVIAVLLVQPGCQSGQPPTQVHTQDRTIRSSVEGATLSSGEMIPATTRMGAGGDLDDAFNAGFDAGAPDDYSPNDDFNPLPPLEPISDGPTVDLADDGYQTYTVEKGDNLWSIAKHYNVSLDEVYAANGLNKNSVIRVGQQIQIPGAGSSVTVKPVAADSYQPSGFDQATTTYTVQAGDNLSKIAKRYDTTVAALKAANGKRSDVIRVGEKLTVPATGEAASATSSANAPAPAPSSTADASGRATGTHTVKAGEYPAKIARQYGMTTNELLAMNSITDPRKLRVGQELRVRGSGSAANVDSRPETVVQPTPVQAVTVVPTQPTPRTGPSEVRVIEADPLIEGEGEFAEPEEDEIFDNAIEIPVIRLEE